MTNPIPPAALEKHIGIIGKTGSGKSNLAKLVAEDLMSRGERVCVLDPTGTWWGMRLLADGKTASSYPMAIFGGQHADLVIAAAHGATIAQVVGTRSLDAIVDLRMMTVSDRTRFFTAFAETLLRANKGTLTLIIDEAHLFMPQGGAKVGGGAPAMLHAGNNLVSLGRGVGLRIVLVTQRAAKLHKDALTQVETLVAMRVLAPQDRRAIKDWIAESASDGGEKLLQSLPSLQTGEAWVWSPELGHLEQEICPLASTFDTGSVRPLEAVLEGGGLPGIDVSDVAELLEKGTPEAAETGDRGRLRKRIADLERELKAAGAGNAEELATLRQDNERLRSLLDMRLRSYAAEFRSMAENCDLLREEVNKDLVPAMPTRDPETLRTPVRTVADNTSTCGEQQERLTGPQQRVVNAIAWFEGLYLPEPSRVQVAFLAGYSPNGGAFNNTLGSLRSGGYIQYASGKRLLLTKMGHNLAEYPAKPGSTADLQNAVMEKLTEPQRRVLRPLIAEYPGAMAHDELAAKASYTASGGAFNNVRGQLRSLGLIDYPERGMARAEDVLFPG